MYAYSFLLPPSKKKRGEEKEELRNFTGKERRKRKEEKEQEDKNKTDMPATSALYISMLSLCFSFFAWHFVAWACLCCCMHCPSLPSSMLLKRQMTARQAKNRQAHGIWRIRHLQKAFSGEWGQGLWLEEEEGMRVVYLKSTLKMRWDLTLPQRLGGRRISFPALRHQHGRQNRQILLSPKNMLFLGGPPTPLHGLGHYGRTLHF